MLKVSKQQMAIFEKIQLKTFKQNLSVQINKEFPFFPEITEDKRYSMISSYVDSAFGLGIKIEKAVLNYVTACWLMKCDIINNESTASFLSTSTFNEVHKTESLKRQAILRYFKKVNQGGSHD